MSDFIPAPEFGLAEVERAIRRLPYLEREALLMKARDGMTYAEIGAVLGLTAADAEARVASALVRLHAVLMCPKRRSWRVRWPSSGRRRTLPRP